MKVLIGVISCNRDRQNQQQARNTWLKDCTEYRFILGRSCYEPTQDELILDAPDDYRNLVQKVRKTIEYAASNGFDYLFKCDVDTYCHVSRLLSSGFENHDYVGRYGGAGYWLSRKAMLALLDTTFPDFDAEDEVVYRNLESKGIPSHEDRRYHSKTKEGPTPDNNLITAHWYMDGNKIIKASDRFKLFEQYYAGASGI